MHYLIYVALLAGALGLSACEREGPAERAGESIDKAVDDAGDGIGEAGDEIEDRM